MKITYGADEAGRGPILGPMVIAVVGLDRGSAISLSKTGIADSKSYGAGPDAQARRAELALRIRQRASCVAMRVIDVDVIDEHTFRGELNVLERRVVGELLSEVEAHCEARIFCDGANMFRQLKVHYPRLQAVDQGESAHVSVAAASIVAKDARDQAFGRIASRYESEFGPIRGGGYLNAATRRFLEAYASRHGGLPPEARKSWGAPKTVVPTLPLFPQDGEQA